MGPTWPGVNWNPQNGGSAGLSTSSGTPIAKFEQNFQLVNALWLSSLVLSLACALLAISLQQWARRYLVAVRRRRTPHNQARIREYLAEGVRDSGIAILVDSMRAGQQLSFVLFVVGLLVPLSTRNLNAGYYAPVIILIMFVLCALLYIYLAIVGILRKKQPILYPAFIFFAVYSPTLCDAGRWHYALHPLSEVLGNLHSRSEEGNRRNGSETFTRPGSSHSGVDLQFFESGPRVRTVLRRDS